MYLKIQKKENTVIYNCIIDILINNEKFDDALKYYEQMKQERFIPDNVTYTLILKLCTETSNLELGKEISDQILNNSSFINDIKLQTSLINFFGKSGNIERAFSIFNSINNKDLVSYTAILSVLINNKEFDDALKYYEQMKQEGFIT